MKKKRPRQVVFLLIISALLIFSLLRLYRGREEGDSVRVTLDGVSIGEWSLDGNETISLNGGTNILRIENGKVWMSEASCPDKICVREGKISRTGECITCLPNKIVVTVYKSDDTVDLVV